ncbi:hypothetical protein RRG08_016548 [Elysia crispata]|uniref:Reverse transcriptase zinc-binding domain-containing protein n=1 Tax=Elysia crispata TaxID=231223 RepID=A0AAE0YR73_9GAST|nr:hypothetical protein RRG08_016548 [Elysia crispata]
MAPLRISILIRSVYDLLPSNANLVRWRKKEDPTCPLCQGRQTTEHVLSSCKIALSQGRYTWRHNRVLQELAAIISTAKGETTLPNTNALIFTTEGGAKSWHGRPVRTTNQIKCLLDGCDDWDVSADLPEWDSHPSIIKETRLRPDIVIHSASTQQLIMVELTVPYRMEEAHIYKREKYMNLTKELENAGYKAVVMPVEDQLAKWYSAGVSNPSRDEGMGSNPGAVQKKTGRHLGVMTWVWPGPLRVSEVQGRNTCCKGGFFSEDSLLSPMSFYLHFCKINPLLSEGAHVIPCLEWRLQALA